MRVLLYQVDGKLPNIALMRLSTYHKQRGDEVCFASSLASVPIRRNFERVFASSIFQRSQPLREQVREKFPEAVTGGTGYRFISSLREVVADMDPDALAHDYSLYPTFSASLGYTQRGCRLDCAFCRMRTREGNATSVATLQDIWRGEPWPKHLHLLDNDFFGQAQWRERLAEAMLGRFKLCFNQGINIRLIDEEQAHWLALAGYWDDSFTKRRLYTAWDNLQDERAFKVGVERLQSAGIQPQHLMVYMLIGFKGHADDPNKLNRTETLDEIFYRFNEMQALGVMPYPMLYDRTQRELRKFQRWVLRRYYKVVPWDKFDERLTHK